jgi:TIR domain
MNRLSRPDFWTQKGLLGLYLYTISLWLKYDVFISYSHIDESWVDGLVGDLAAGGLNVFYDKKSLRAGEDWMKQIQIGIRKSAAAIIVLSPDADQSKEVRKELDDVRRAGKKIIQVLHRGNPTPFIPQLQCVDFRDESKRSSKIAELIRLLSFRLYLSSRLVLILVLFFALSGVTVKATFLRGTDEEIKQWLIETQSRIQVIDEQINAKKVKTCEKKLYGAGLSGVTSYCDYENRVVGKDLWEDSGRLKWRSFFSNGELIARDEFIDSGKERSFFDSGGNRFLIDHYTTTGELIKKQWCPNGTDCRDRFFEARSPLPPPEVMALAPLPHSGSIFPTPLPPPETMLPTLSPY